PRCLYDDRLPSRPARRRLPHALRRQHKDHRKQGPDRRQADPVTEPVSPLAERHIQRPADMSRPAVMLLSTSGLGGDPEDYSAAETASTASTANSSAFLGCAI